MPSDPVLGSQRVEGMSVVYTIGYEGTDIDRFVATLRTVGVTLLADVRAVAVSRKKGFSKNGLRERLDDGPNRYVRHAKKVPRRHHHQGDAESQPETW
jgi:uncharacterized protein (DUF488 family)